MELYNSLINDINAALPSNPKIWDYDENACWKDNGQSELVLTKDAAFELGASTKGSASIVTYSSSKNLIDGDKVYLYGPDITELNADCDFARIVKLHIGVLDDEDEVIYRTLKDIEFAKYHVYPQGYMIRMSPESYREQVRVSKSAISAGINFKALGCNYIREYKKDANVISAQVIFVTDPSVNYDKLKDLAKKSNAVTNTLTHILEGLPTDCSVCALKDICDEVDGMKELHFGVGAEGAEHH